MIVGQWPGWDALYESGEALMDQLSRVERRAFCNCVLHRTAGTYARPTVEGRSHATRHHLVAERFFGRSTNRRGTKTEGIFASCPWSQEGVTKVFCYECHEELLHNPVFLAEDVQRFAQLVKARCLDEEQKSGDRSKLAGRIRLFHEALSIGLQSLQGSTEPGET
jgi:hypothetical protein